MEKKSNDVKSETRYIPKAIQREVYQRDEGHCSYTSSEGKKCGEKNFLELDHIHPWSLGGNSTSENLRLLCRTHNQYRNQTL
ncbi:MAG: HNH endonuclease [Deltaproteobacteria bacterium]|nr:HNH endonuclease [Deltaproteobacteria bacterium]